MSWIQGWFPDMQETVVKGNGRDHRQLSVVAPICSIPQRLLVRVVVLHKQLVVAAASQHCVHCLSKPDLESPGVGSLQRAPLTLSSEI